MDSKTYFDIYRLKNNSLTTNPQKPKAIFQWIALFVGVLIQPFFSYYKDNGEVIWAEAYKNWEFLLFALIVALIAFPGIYKTAFDVNRPKWIQMIPIFTAGLGWQTLVDSAVSGATKKDPSEAVAAFTEFIFFFC